MKLINLEQRSPEWHEFRSTRIGATDFNKFMAHKGKAIKVGTTSFEKHIYEKINRIEIPDNQYMAFGREKEPELLALFNKKYNTHCMGHVAYSDANPRIFVSFDGYCVYTGILVEIKTTSKVKEIEVLESYIYQFIHQMNTGKMKTMKVLIHWRRTNTETYYRVDYQEDIECFIIYRENTNESLLMAEMPYKQWLAYCEEFLAILDSKPSYEMETAIVDYELLDQEIELLTQQKETIRKLLIDNYKDGGIVKDYKISKSVRNSIAYADIVKDNAIAIDDKYKKQSTSYLIKKMVAK